jgi:hypothetical protein
MKYLNKLMRLLLLLSIFVNFIFQAKAQTKTDSILMMQYDSAFSNLKITLNNNGLFKDAVFIVENAYFQGSLDKSKFDIPIKLLKSLCIEWAKTNKLQDYRFADSLNFQKNFSIFKVLTDTIRIVDTGKIIYYHPPFRYDFGDFFGKDSWANMFVSKLLITRKGNCHSLPYLYKILADELRATCWLSLAPNHIYIKNRCKKIGWYNTELTSGEFPIDAWITTSGYIPVKAVQTGIYMDTLSNQQAIALCVLDLAKGYEFQTKNYYDGFIIKCCDLILQYHPVNVQAMLLKAETLKRIYEKDKQDKFPKLTSKFNEMEELYAKLFDLGYREMPEKMYLQWLRSVTEQRNKYGNKQLNETLKGKTK